MRIRKPSKATLRAFAIGITAVLCTLAILSAVFPFPEGTGYNFLSIGLGTGRQAQAQPVSTNGMAYAIVNKSGCTVHKGNVQIRLDFYLEPEDVRYKDCVINGTLVPFHTHFIYLPPDFTQADIEAAVDANLGNFYKAFEDGWDKVQGGMRHGWAVSQRIRPVDYSTTLNAGQYTKLVANCQASIDTLTEFSYKPDGEIQGQTFPSTEIDIGGAATDRSGNLGLDGYTKLCKDNPANDTGSIDTLEFYVYVNLQDVKAGTFYGGGTSWANRDYETIGTVLAGSKQSFTGLDCDVQTDDIVGYYSSDGNIEYDNSGGAGVLYKNTDTMGAGTQSYSSLDTDAVYSLYGTGDTGGGEPSISNTPDNYGFGVLEIGTNATTGLGYSSITNNGTVAVDVAIQGSNLTGGDDTWALSDTATPGENIYGLRASTDNETLYEYYGSGDLTGDHLYGVHWAGQTFTPSTTHTITSVQLLLFREGTPGTVTISITATNASGVPAGDDLCSAAINGDTLTTNTSGEWKEITFDTSATLTSSTQYAIVARALSGDIDNSLAWRENCSDAAYGGGTQVYSDDNNISWATEPTCDFMFKEYGADFDVIVKQTPTYNTLVSNLTVNATQDWGLLLCMPTSLTNYGAQQMTGTITLIATEHT